MLLSQRSKYSSIGICFNDQGICVWDNGKPIPQPERQKIFESGYRGDKSKEYKGSGLGLFLARQLAEQFGGGLELISKPSDFDESLPKAGNAFFIKLQVK